MKKIILSVAFVLGLIVTANAQKGNNLLQVSGQVGLPTGDLADVAKTGFGGTLKGLYGIGLRDQHVTLEAGYNHFSVKKLPAGVSANYSSIPIYTGYRYTIGKFHLEPQAGISINKVAGTANSISKSESSTNFAWATGLSYSFNDLELGVRYQSSDTKNNDESITFVGIRLGYNFSL